MSAALCYPERVNSTAITSQRGALPAYSIQAELDCTACFIVDSQVEREEKKKRQEETGEEDEAEELIRNPQLAVGRE